MKFTQDILENTSEQFHRFLFEDDDGEIARDFLKNRKVASLETFKDFEIGYCPPKFGYPSEQSLYVDNHLWWMRGRLIVTIRDQHNRIVSFAGRVIDANREELHQDLLSKINEPLLQHIEGDTNKIDSMIKDWSDSKWINEIFAKKDYLYGLNIAKRAIFDMGYAIIVEGYLDAMALWLNGFPNTVALCGVAMTDMHLALLRRYTKHLVFCLDGDESGSKAVDRVVKLVQDKYSDLSYYIVYLLKDNNGKGLDPEDMLISEHKDILVNALQEAAKRKNLKKRFMHLSDDLTYKVMQSKTQIVI